MRVTMRRFPKFMKCKVFPWVGILGWAIGGALGVVAPATVCGQDLVRFQRSEVHMGMSFGVVLYARDEAVANRAFTAAFARIGEMNGIFSDYDTDSELSRAVALAPTRQPVAVSRDLAHVLAVAQLWSDRSQGAFDVTIGPLTKLWRRARRTKELPTANRIELERAKVDYRQLRIDETGRTIELGRAGMRIDLGGIVPGYAADEALRILAMHGITRALVNASGDITVGDPPPGASAWKVEIGPLTPGGPPSQTVWVANAAVSTSGDAFQFLEINGKRYSHIIDPRTGWGVPNRSSVTAIAKSGITADVLATAVTVLGPDPGSKLIEETPGAAAYIIVAEGDAVRTVATRRFGDFQQPTKP